MLQLPHLKHRGTKKKKRGLGQDASCYCSSFGTHSQSFSLSLPSLSPSAGEQPATITDLLKVGTYVHFFFLLTHSLLTASKAHREREKVLGRTGPPFFSLYSTNVVFQKAQTNPQCCITFFFPSQSYREEKWLDFKSHGWVVLHQLCFVIGCESLCAVTTGKKMVLYKVSTASFFFASLVNSIFHFRLSCFFCPLDFPCSLM